MRSYHIEHGMGWGVAADRPKLMAALPMLSDEAVRKLLDRLDAAGRPLTPNTEDWGLAAEELPEWRAA
jgi:hypothetical protein